VAVWVAVAWRHGGLPASRCELHLPSLGKRPVSLETNGSSRKKKTTEKKMGGRGDPMEEIRLKWAYHQDACRMVEQGARAMRSPG
jgi:hypothetical protein